MQVKIISRIALIALVGFAVSYGDDAEIYRKYLDAICAYPEKGDVSWVTPQTEQILIQKAKLDAKSSDPTINSASNLVLLELGDPPTVAAYVADYKSGKAKLFPEIQILPYLIEDVEHGSHSNLTKNWFYHNVMDEATATMYMILRFYPCFPPQTRAWADKWQALSSGGPNCAANQLMRAWWQHNKDAVLAHKYGDATWLPTPEQEKALTESLKVQNTEPDLSVSTLKTPVQATERKSKPLIARVDPDSDNGWELPIILSIIITTALAGGFWLYLYTSPKKI